MRKDMSKVVTEKPRKGGRLKSPKGEKRELQRQGEDAPKREKIRQKWTDGYNEKQFTDVLGPLHRFLNKQVGRKWDDVYSEITKVLPKGTIQARHIWQHIWQFVEKHVLIDGKKVLHSDNLFWRYRIELEKDQLYIHPESRILCKAKGPEKKPKKKKPLDRVFVDKTHECRKLKGIWYLCEIVAFTPQYRMVPYWVKDLKNTYKQFVGIKDALYGLITDPHFLHDKVRGFHYCKSKKQMNHREIKRWIPEA